MPTLPNMGIVTPTLGGDSGTWDDKINTALGLVDAHDHTSGKGVAIAVAALNINADLPMGAYGLTSLGKASFSAITAPTTGSKALFVNTADNELYWRTNSGTNVKLTSGTSINTTLVGGIVGDYSTVGAEVAFDDANKRYTLKDGTSPSKKWARIAAGPVRLYEYNSTVSNYVEHISPAGLAASYTVTWPTATPATAAIMQMSAAGVLAASNTLTADLDLGTAYKVKHGNRVIYCPVFYNLADVASGGPLTHTNGNPRAEVPVSTVAYFPLLTGVEDNAKLVSVEVVLASTPANNVTWDIVKANGSGYTSLGVTLAANTAIVLDMASASLANTPPLFVKATTGGSTGCNIVWFALTYKVT